LKIHAKRKIRKKILLYLSLELMEKGAEGKASPGQKMDQIRSRKVGANKKGSVPSDT
jgi:hypothetical protein